jgi:hypothetical protein
MKKLISIIVLFLITQSSYALEEVRNKNWEPVKCYQDQSIAASVGLTGLGSTVFTQSEVDRSSAMMIQSTGDAVRWTDDGTTPTATLGFFQTEDNPPFFYTGDLSALLFIEESTSTDIFVCLYK